MHDVVEHKQSKYFLSQNEKEGGRMEASSLQANQLVTFHRVATAGSISAAADEMGLSQPAVSVQMRNLSRAVGEPLLRRHKGGVSLTEVGRALVPFAAQLARSYLAAVDYVDSLRSLVSGSLSIVASNTVAAHLLPSFLAAFNQCYSAIGLSLVATNSQNVVESLADLRADVGFVEGPSPEFGLGLEASIVGGDSLVLVVGDKLWPQAAGKSAEEILSSLPMVVRERGSGTRRVAEAAFADAGIGVANVVELAGTEAVKEAVMSGLGTAVISSLAVRREVEMGYMHQIDLGLVGMRRDFYMLVAPRGERSRATDAFVEVVSRRVAEEQSNKKDR